MENINGNTTRAESLVYRIDAEDRITYVNDAWTRFAEKNEGHEIRPENVLGCAIWTYVKDPTVRAIYRSLIEHARSGTFVNFSYRCDAPDKRRWFSMTIRRVENREIEFVSTLEREEDREMVPLLDSSQDRNGRFVRVCSWCQKVAVAEDKWVPIENALKELHLMEEDHLPKLTHGICDPCAEGMIGYAAAIRA